MALPQRRRGLPSGPVAVVGVALLVGASLWFVASLSACYGPSSERLSCEAVLPPNQASFEQLVTLVNDTDKGCLASPCHSAKTQQHGIRLDTAKLVYQEFSSRPDLFYSVLSVGIMPDGGTRWDDDDLLVFRSWYCNGAFPP